MRTSHEKSCRGLNERVALAEPVAGQLLEDHPVERLVLVERADHPVAIRPGRVAEMVLLVAVALPEPRDIQPVPAPAFPVRRCRQQLVDQSFVCVRIGICDKRGDGLGRRRQSVQVEAQTPDQRARIGLA